MQDRPANIENYFRGSIVLWSGQTKIEAVIEGTKGIRIGEIRISFKLTDLLYLLRNFLVNR